MRPERSHSAFGHFQDEVQHMEWQLAQIMALSPHPGYFSTKMDVSWKILIFP
jgi:hypothetical protein